MASFYRPRNPRSTPLWGLLESRYEELAGVWEDRFEARFGFWRGRLTDPAVAKYLDCGLPEAGFAQLRCDGCGAERLLTFSRPNREGSTISRAGDRGSPRRSSIGFELRPRHIPAPVT